MMSACHKGPDFPQKTSIEPIRRSQDNADRKKFLWDV
jgi:hypothetical protein